MKLKQILQEIKDSFFKELEKKYKSTAPKIMCNEIFLNKVSVPDDWNKISNIDENDCKKEEVKLLDIVPTQRHVNINNLKAVKDVGTDTNALLIERNGVYYVVDGHHRISMNLLQDEYKITAKVCHK